MMQFESFQVGQEVFIQLGRDYIGADKKGWLAVKIGCLIGDREPNPGRTLVEVSSPWLECGWGMFDVSDLFPRPDKRVTLVEVETYEIVPDSRRYEFGIGQIDDDPYYAQTQMRPTGKTRVVEMIKCDCGHTVPRVQAMNASTGLACPDCYDRMSE